ncbi:MAG: hypothetical protein HY320_03330, partial [Armatimonadetes bacterium]|nr:hypothetical protein [Armatimonadota bacterium]
MPDPDEDQVSASAFAAGFLGQYAGDREMFLELLAGMLQAVVPEHLTVKRQGGWLRRSRPVSSLKVDLGDVQFTLRAARG